MHVAQENNNVIGFALYYISYSTWKGKLVFEDLFVIPDRRKDGVGGLLFDKVVETAKRWKVKEWTGRFWIGMNWL